MKVIFVKNFIQQLEVTYGAATDSNIIPTRKFKINPKSVKEVIDKLNKEIEPAEVKEVVLVGRAGILKDIEDYYKNIKGVTIIWQ